ncbi:DUF2939 domain-containing protein [Altererythrobacter aerius]|uniref:DUF2939 domain-containing protein n=1 Tax=Tsuneonella aeria TaxID=1837929 RepID=A0A6I4TGJ0_9SPHN|nr:DUF2939 domain-containing protein [Tsuneonella aeria]MXO75766.1 DUF2939 domain-containing protein [Tsuneonella aeria]
MSRNKVLVILASIAVIGAAALWYFASPAYAMNQLKNAAQSGDSTQLEESIDFPKVRESLKTQLRAVMAREMAKPEIEDNPFGKIGAVIAMGMVDGIVEGFVTPESMYAMIEEGKMQKPGEIGAQAGEAKSVNWDIDRDGFDTFTATPKAADGKSGPCLIFERYGLGWKLSGLKLPPEATAAP